MRTNVMGLCCVFSAVSGIAGTIRHDVDDAEYIALASETLFESTGFHQAGGSLCTATLISPEWVLAAAHCVDDSSNHTFRLGATSTGGVVYSAAETVIHESWDKNEIAAGFDIALIRLDTPIFDATPAQIYRGSGERRQVVTHVGYGQTGTGLTGSQAGTGGTKRAGQNTVDAFGNNVNQSWSNAIMFSDFDNPDDSSDNALGRSAPLDLEYMIAAGDSGGGGYLQIAGIDYLAGLHSFISTTTSDGNPNADYGDLMASTRVGQFNGWIDTSAGNAVTRFSNGQSFGWEGSGWSVAGGMDDNDTAVINGGTVTVSTGNQVAKYAFVDGGELQITGGSLTVDTLILKRDGRLQAQALTGHLLNQSGVFAPVVASSGTAIDGDFTQEAGGTLEVDLQPVPAGAALVIDGVVSLAGTLSLLNGAAAALDLYEVITLIEAGIGQASIVGVFDTIEGIDAGDNSLFAITYEAGSVLLQRALPGDVNLDGLVDGEDLDQLASVFGSQGTWLDGDFNGDHLVNLDDLTILGSFFGSGVPEADLVSFSSALQLTSFAVPEPAGLIPLAAGCFAFFRRRR